MTKPELDALLGGDMLYGIGSIFNRKFMGSFEASTPGEKEYLTRGLDDNSTVAGMDETYILASYNVTPSTK